MKPSAVTASRFTMPFTSTSCFPSLVYTEGFADFQTALMLHLWWTCFHIQTQSCLEVFSLSDRVLCLHSTWNVLFAGLASGSVASLNLKVSWNLSCLRPLFPLHLSIHSNVASLIPRLWSCWMCLNATGLEEWAAWARPRKAPAACCWSAPTTAPSVCGTPGAACSCARWGVTPKRFSVWRWVDDDDDDERILSANQASVVMDGIRTPGRY